MIAHPTDQLSDYLDGDLATDTFAAVAAHVRGCETCQTVVADLHALRESAATWGATSMPPADALWTGIAARLSGPRAADVTAAAAYQGHDGVVASSDGSRATAWYRRRWSVGVPELALAASLVAAVAGAALYRRAPAPVPPVADATSIVAEIEAVGPPEAGAVPVNFADAQYDAAIRDLERVLLDQRDRLDPRTVIVLERNLRVIDDAIREARQALGDDPANALLNSHLASARRRKLDLLRRAALITEAN